MRKIRVALVLLLLLSFIVATNVASASTTISSGSMGDFTSLANSRALLQNIEKNLVTGSSGIGQMSQDLSAYTLNKAEQSIANALKVTGSNKPGVSIKPPSMQGYGMPMSGIGDAIKALGSINVHIRAPIDIAKSINMPRLAILE